MEYREIVAVTGMGGLYHLLAKKSEGAIVRNLADKSTKFISARRHNVTLLESIEIYTSGENVGLHMVLQSMKDHAAQMPVPDAKKMPPDEIVSYFAHVFPSMDRDKVYVSDMKKILKWYEVLRENDLLNFDDLLAAEAALNAALPEAVAPAENVAANTHSSPAETLAEADILPAEKPAKKTTKKKTEVAPDTNKEETAVKKTARVKKKKEEE